VYIGNGSGLARIICLTFLTYQNPEYMTIPTSIAPWLSVRNSRKAVDWYKSAFGAIEVYRLETPDGGLVVRLSVHGAEFWVSGESPDDSSLVPESLGGGSVRMILTVADPDTLFLQALAAGATQVFPVGEGHGWKLGRLVDPFGLHWEIGHPLIF
jgi:PhnB protein